jgi:uncharacterized protein YhaN
MRFARLSLERYGHFEGCELNFRPGNPDLHVIYGANEAGKTMSMAAVSDLLFGFGGRSPYNFLFDYSLLRVGAIIEEDGNSTLCRRRKAASGTLVDASDAPIDEGLLLAMLRGQTRETFRLSFSLDQEGLRRGGRAIVEAKDDVGQALFAAGSGLTSVAEELVRLDAEADAIWGKRAAAKRAYTQAERQLAENVRAVREQGLKPKAWTDARTALEDRKSELEALEERRGALVNERHKAERVRRIGPNVRIRGELLAKIETHAATVFLTPEREELALKAMQDAELAAQARIVAERLGGEAKERAEAVAADPKILAEAETIESLVEDRGAVTKAAADLTGLKSEKTLGAQLVERLRSDTGVAGDALPTRLVVVRLRELARAHAEMKSGLRELELSEADLVARQEPLAEGIADAALSESLPPLVAAVDAARKVGGDIDDRCAEALRRVAAAQEDISLALARLAPWTGSTAKLRALPTVAQEEIDQAKARWNDLAASVEQERATASRLAEEAAALKVQIDGLSGGGAAVSAEALGAVRLSRDSMWEELRDHIRNGTPPVDPEGSITGFEEATREADLTADRRYALAEESGRLVELAQRRDVRLLEADQAVARGTAAEASLNATMEIWRRRLVEAGLPDLEPVRYQAWLADRNQTIDAAAALTRLSEEADADTRRRAAAITALVDQIGPSGKTPSADEILAPILLRAEQLRSSVEERDQQYRVDRSELRQIEENLASQQRRKNQLSEESKIRTAEWATALDGTGLALPIDAAEARLEVFDNLRAALEEDARLSQRIAGIERDTKQFEDTVTTLADRLGVPANAVPAVRLEQLRTRLFEARTAHRMLEGLGEEIERRGRETDEAAAAIEAVNATLAPLMAEGGAADMPALASAVEASRSLRKLREALADAEQQIVAAGDGYSLADLVAAVEAEDPDQITVRTEGLDRELGELNAAISEAATAHGDARRAFSVLEEVTSSAPDAAADAEQARAEMSVQAESYLLKRSQAMILRWAIEEYRERHQDPLLVRASELFSTLTLGRYTALRVEMDRASPRLLGIYNDGRGVVDVSGMSEGTTDQLFLALRLAAIEGSVAAGVRLPFLADDLFVNFDDERAEAGFRVLAELAQSTQVLFFTHHIHLAAIARRVLGAELHSECALA